VATVFWLGLRSTRPKDLGCLRISDLWNLGWALKAWAMGLGLFFQFKYVSWFRI
jgi:hypothetical protein